MTKKSFLPLIGGLIAAIAASACCILPLLLGAVSAGTVGLSTVLVPSRPLFIALTVFLLGSAFYFTYRPQKTGCETECCVPDKPFRTRRFNKALLWVVTVFALGALAYPEVAASRARKDPSKKPPVVVSSSAQSAVFTIGNMTCEECTLSIVKALKNTSGVYDAKVDFASKRATVRYNAKRVTVAELRKAIEKTGYSVTDPGKQVGGKKVENAKGSIPLTTLSDELTLKEAFNKESDKTRLVLLVSPT
ncbi:MAG TPA: mercuric transporter MerT family protein [Chthonomonadaceae bacterium]|nr:mercuric transporter MerT family protein [Chthonomonadaceae bacterium]